MCACYICVCLHLPPQAGSVVLKLAIHACVYDRPRSHCYVYPHPPSCNDRWRSHREIQPWSPRYDRWLIRAHHSLGAQLVLHAHRPLTYTRPHANSRTTLTQKLDTRTHGQTHRDSDRRQCCPHTLYDRSITSLMYGALDQSNTGVKTVIVKRFYSLRYARALLLPTFA